MTLQVKLKRNEPVERALKRLKRILDREGIVRELRDRKYFMKPSEKRRKKSAAAQARRKKEERDLKREKMEYQYQY